MRRSALFALLLTASVVRADEPSRGVVDSVARTVSPAFCQLDDRRLELRAAPPAFHPPKGRSAQLGYHSSFAWRPNESRWVQVDLGESRPIDTIVVVPAAGPGGELFPRRFSVSVSDSADFRDATIISEVEDRPPSDRPVIVPVTGTSAQFVRFTATQLPGRHGIHLLAVGELMVLSGNRNLAAGRPVSALNEIVTPPEWAPTNLVDGQSVVGPPRGPNRSPTNGYHSSICETQDVVKWVQVDLGESRPLEEVRLIPALPIDFPDRSGFGFPVRFKVEASDDPEFTSATLLRDSTAADIPNPGDGPVSLAADGVTARYVRVTATRLWERTADFVFALAEMQVYSGGVNVARGKAVTALDSIENQKWARRYLTDGFASQNELVEWPTWAATAAATAAQEDELREVEAAWSAARESALVTASRIGVGFGGVWVLVGIGLVWRVRVRQRRETEKLRDRIARDLHDEVGSNLGSIILLAQAARWSDTDTVRKDLDEVGRVAQQTGNAMRDLVWLLARGPDTSENLLAKMRETAAGLLRGVTYSLEATDDCLPRRLNLEFKRQVFLAYKEAIHNAARHSGATSVTIRCHREGRRFVLEIEDDGRGFDESVVKAGTGLRSLRARAEALGGTCEIAAAPSGGTIVRFRVPVK